MTFHQGWVATSCPAWSSTDSPCDSLQQRYDISVYDASRMNRVRNPQFDSPQRGTDDAFEPQEFEVYCPSTVISLRIRSEWCGRGACVFRSCETVFAKLCGTVPIVHHLEPIRLRVQRGTVAPTCHARARLASRESLGRWPTT